MEHYIKNPWTNGEQKAQMWQDVKNISRCEKTCEKHDNHIDSINNILKSKDISENTLKTIKKRETIENKIKW